VPPEEPVSGSCVVAALPVLSNSSPGVFEPVTLNSYNLTLSSITLAVNVRSTIPITSAAVCALFIIKNSSIDPEKLIDPVAPVPPMLNSVLLAVVNPAMLTL